MDILVRIHRWSQVEGQDNLAKQRIAESVTVALCDYVSTISGEY